MRKSFRAVLTAVGAVTAILASATAASADTAGYGELFTDSNMPFPPDCVNSVAMGRAGDQIYAYGVTKCTRSKSIIRAEVALTGGGGKYGFETKTTGCTFATYCETPKVYLQEHYGVTYMASNAGTVNSDSFPPENAISHAQRVGGLAYRGGSEAGSGRVRWADFDGDTRADYWIVNPSGSVNVYLNQGGDGYGGWQDIGQVATGLTSDSTRVRFADFDGDRKADYLLINPDGSVNVHLNKGGDRAGGWQHIGKVATGLTSDANRVRFADIDGDGRADYNLLDGNGGIHAFLNRGGDTSAGWVDQGQ
ncbi:FG-GAP repeat domain-containing protein, partial [Streptomyces sp. NPDC059762]